jgi:tripartite-type tricarboxylate transporter receptor subunit TctC
MLMKTIFCAALTAVAAPLSMAASADNYPSRPIRLIVPSTPGSGNDIVGRLVAQKLGDVLGQNIVVDNRAGASGTVGSAMAANEAADGYTLVLGTSASHGSAKATYPKLSYDPVNDFTPISRLYKTRLVLAAHKDFPVNTVPELISYLKKNPDQVSYGTPGEGTPHMLAGETLKTQAGVSLAHIPYKGGGQAMNDLAAGHIQLAIATVPSALDMARTGRIKIIAVTDRQKIEALPNVPTLAEFYPAIDISGWAGLFGPKNLPEPIVKKLSTALQTAMSSSDVKTKLHAGGMEPSMSTPEELTATVRSEVERWQGMRQSGTVNPAK